MPYVPSPNLLDSVRGARNTADFTSTGGAALAVAESPPPQRARGGNPNLAARARVDVSSAALAWVKAELRTQDRITALRGKLDDALDLGVPHDVLLDLLVGACERYDLPPDRIPDSIRSVIATVGMPN